MIAMAKVHYFKSTGEAYDDSQTGYWPDDFDGPINDETMSVVEDGDVLVVESENAVAVMVQAWPTAIDAEHAGENFHVLRSEASWSRITQADGRTAKDYTASAEAARAEAAKLEAAR